jgi:hypothetical protein
MKERPESETLGAQGEAGGGLLSRDLSIGVPSALQGLTTVFGMGTGVAPALQPPANLLSMLSGMTAEW